MASPTLVAAVAVLLPAMGLLWAYLHRYERYFEQNRLFFALVIGLFAGIAVRALETYVFPFDNPQLLQPAGPPWTTGTLVYSFAYTALGLALLETMGKTAVLGFKKFRSRKDTPYYGAALGLGFGAMWVNQVVAVALPYAGTGLRVDAAALVYDAFLLMLAMGLLLAQAASSIWVGRGSANGTLWKGAMHGTLWLAPALACYWVFANLGDQVYSALAALAWGLFAMTFANRRILETVVPPEIRDMVRKERRREARRIGRQ